MASVELVLDRHHACPNCGHGLNILSFKDQTFPPRQTCFACAGTGMTSEAYRTWTCDNCGTTEKDIKKESVSYFKNHIRRILQADSAIQKAKARLNDFERDKDTFIEEKLSKLNGTKPKKRSKARQRNTNV
jgi:predicted RNA-binding Zn-ribbon protein involved in translation (DUF1610 family)